MQLQLKKDWIQAIQQFICSNFKKSLNLGNLTYDIIWYYI